MTGTIKLKAPVPRTSQLATIPPYQRRQSALQSCLETCEDLGFTEKETSTQQADACQAPQTACTYVNVAQRLAKQQAELEILEDRESYGELIKPVQVNKKVR